MDKDKMKKEQCRKWLLTINNPEDKGYTHDRLREVMAEFTTVTYWCMGDEAGESGTYHTHLFMYSTSPITALTIYNKIPEAHRDKAKGTCEQNRAYVFKLGEKFNRDLDTGVYLYTDKKGVIHKGIHYDTTNEEIGEMPDERQGKRNDLYQLYDMIKDGMSTYEILEENPQYINQVDRIEKVRQTVLEEKYKNEWRTLEVEYIWGVTGAGKTRSVMERYGYSNVYRVTDYQHPFDSYKGQDVVVFEEFRSSLYLDDMLKYLDGYPVELSARYMNRQACFTKVYIITNIDLRNQYPNVQENEPMSWQAFLRRINRVRVFTGINESYVHDTDTYLKDYFPVFKTPFDEEEKGA